MFRGSLQCTILVLFSIFTVIQCIWNPTKQEVHPVCNTKACLARGREYHENMNLNVDPCTDFYTFACGFWEAHHPKPPYMDWDVAHRMHKDTLNILHRLLEQMPGHSDDREMNKLKWVYDACMKIPTFGLYGPKEIAQQITRIGRYPQKKIWDLHNDYLKLTGESAFFEYSVGSYKRDLEVPMLQFYEPLSAYGSIFHNMKWHHAEEHNYSEALFKMLSSLGLPDSEKALRRKVFNAIFFRRRLNVILDEMYHTPPDEVKQWMKPKEFEKQFVERAYLRHQNKYNIAIPWERIARILLHAIAPPLVKDLDIVILCKSKYFQRLANILAKAPEDEIADHMEVHFIERHLKRTEEVKRYLRESWHKPPSHMVVLRQNEPRWLTCVRETNLEPSLAKLLITKWFKPQYKDQVVKIIGGIKDAVDTQMTKSVWLNDKSKEMTRKRLNEIKASVGEPPWLNDDELVQAYGPSKIIQPSAFLDNSANLMFVHATMLQSPIFDSDIPALYNLATMGFVFGHEFYHVIHDCGTYKNLGDRTYHLWTPDMTMKCEERKQCFISQYNKLTLIEFLRRYNLTPKIDTSVSFIENYPDVMGLQAAYMLHENLLKRHDGKCEVLPGFAGYSCDQMFFIAFANMFCGAPPARRALSDLKRDIHSISPVRVNGALMNLDAFAEAFQCGARTPMNPTIKCDLWK